ncbi:MAG: pyruvate kinase [Lachnospiraceae bacterium]
MIRRTKIVCTMGPAVNDEAMIRQLILEGMNIARFNMSHGSHEEHGSRLAMLKKAREELKLPVAALLDTKGPEIRLGDLEQKQIVLKQGQMFTLTTNEILGNKDCASITYQGLPFDVTPGNKILIDDGLVEMEVDSVTGNEIQCLVKNTGVISGRKGVNVPGVSLSLPFINEKDYNDLKFAVEAGFDFVAASFTRTAEDIRELKKILTELGGEKLKIIAKIENSQGVENLDEILELADGVMIARGDMGVEVPLEEVPVIQKKIIKKVYSKGKQVITATQMLDSMMQHPRPTRAESSDVANAVYDGTSAVMLSGETASGQYPIECVRTMARIVQRAEQDIDYRKQFLQSPPPTDMSITNAISKATVNSAIDLDAKVIVTVTESGRTAYMISRYRPFCPIAACTTNEQSYRQLALSWGVVPLLMEGVETLEEQLKGSLLTVENASLAMQGDLVVLTAGVPIGESGTTNLLKIQTI